MKISTPPSQQTTSAAFRPTFTTSIPQNTSSPLVHGIMNDSSFVAVTQLDGTRTVIFQDIDGTIRQASTPGSSSSWSTASNTVVVSDARKLTPMSGFLRLYGSPAEADNQVKHATPMRH